MGQDEQPNRYILLSAAQKVQGPQAREHCFARSEGGNEHGLLSDGLGSVSTSHNSSPAEEDLYQLSPSAQGSPVSSSRSPGKFHPPPQHVKVFIHF